jgi:hypothetical protein
MAMEQGTDTRETADLIASDKVEGTEVYRPKAITSARSSE